MINLYIKNTKRKKKSLQRGPGEKIEFSFLTHEINVLTYWTILAFKQSKYYPALICNSVIIFTCHKQKIYNLLIKHPKFTND